MGADDLTFGQWLQQRRLALHLTQRQLGNIAGYSDSMIRKIEADERRPALDTIAQLADALQIPNAQLTVFRRFALGQQDDMPALPAPESAPPQSGLKANRLPRPMMRFVGRETEIARARMSLQQDDVRLVTITGIGGIGKTRLALQVADELQEAFKDGVVFIDLAPVTDPTFLPLAIAQGLNVPQFTGQSVQETLTYFLAEKYLLLVLDNFEQVVLTAPFLDSLLQNASHLKMLVTSRVVLGIYGEHTLEVPPLPLPSTAHVTGTTGQWSLLANNAAVQIFVQRARAARADFALTEENASMVAQICRELDGLPLAIELAAARVGVLPPQALVRRLGNRLDVLVGGSRTMPMRHQTLRNTIAWSYELLPLPEQTLLRRLSVFVGGWTVDMADAVCRGGDESGRAILDSMQTLLEHSLVRPVDGAVGEPRFTILATIREYALEQLTLRAEVEVMRERHLRYFRDLAEEAEPHIMNGQIAWLDQLSVDNDNLRAALAWATEGGTREDGVRLAAALLLFWTFRPHMREGYDWWMQLLAAPEPLPQPLVATAYSRASWYAWFSGHHDQVPPLCEIAIAASDATGDLRSRIIALQFLALVNYDLEQQLNLVEQELQAAREWGAAWWLGLAHWNKGISLMGHDDGGAQSALEESLRLFRSTGDVWGRIWVLGELVTITMRRADDAQVTALLEESMGLAGCLGDRASIASILSSEGELAYRRGDLQQADDLLSHSITMLADAGNRPVMLHKLADLGQVALMKGDVERAAVIADEVQHGFQWLIDPYGMARGLRLSAAVARARGQAVRAFALLRESLGHAHALDTSRKLEMIEVLAGILTDCGSRAEVARLWGAASAERARQRWPVPPVVRVDYNRDVALARAEVNAATWDVAWAEGAAMSLDEVIAVSLSQGN